MRMVMMGDTVTKNGCDGQSALDEKNATDESKLMSGGQAL